MSEAKQIEVAELSREEKLLESIADLEPEDGDGILKMFIENDLPENDYSNAESLMDLLERVISDFKGYEDQVSNTTNPALRQERYKGWYV